MNTQISGNERNSAVDKAGRIFRYERGKETGRAEALEYGSSVGVPEAQLDWP